MKSSVSLLDFYDFALLPIFDAFDNVSPKFGIILLITKKNISINTFAIKYMSFSSQFLFLFLVDEVTKNENMLRDFL